MVHFHIREFNYTSYDIQYITIPDYTLLIDLDIENLKE